MHFKQHRFAYNGISKKTNSGFNAATQIPSSAIGTQLGFTKINRVKWCIVENSLPFYTPFARTTTPVIKTRWLAGAQPGFHFVGGTFQHGRRRPEPVEFSKFCKNFHKSARNALFQPILHKILETLHQFFAQLDEIDKYQRIL